MLILYCNMIVLLFKVLAKISYQNYKFAISLVLGYLWQVFSISTISG